MQLESIITKNLPSESFNVLSVDITRLRFGANGKVDVHFGAHKADFYSHESYLISDS